MQNNTKESKIKNFFPYIYFSLITVSAALILILSLVLGKTKIDSKLPSTFYIVNMSRDCENLAKYVDNLLEIINGSNDTLSIISHRIIFTSNWTRIFEPTYDPSEEIIDNAPNNTFTHYEGLVLRAFKEFLSKKSSNTIRIITQAKFTNISQAFFNYPGVKVRTFDPVGNDLLLNELITGDSKKLLISSSLFDSKSFGRSRVVSMRFHNGVVIANDIERFFNVSWLQLDSTDNKTIPPNTRFWKKNFEALTNMKHPCNLSNGAIVFVAQSKQDLLPPNRDDVTVDTTTLINKAKKRLLLSASFFNMDTNLFFQNAIAKAAEKGIKVRILVSGRSQVPRFNDLLKQAATVAGLHNISVKVCAEDAGVPDFLIIDNYLLFASGPFAGTLYGKSLGIALLIQDETTTNDFEDFFNEDWNNVNNSDFSSYLNEVYPKQFSS